MAEFLKLLEYIWEWEAISKSSSVKIDEIIGIPFKIYHYTSFIRLGHPLPVSKISKPSLVPSDFLFQQPKSHPFKKMCGHPSALLRLKLPTLTCRLKVEFHAICVDVGGEIRLAGTFFLKSKLQDKLDRRLVYKFLCLVDRYTYLYDEGGELEDVSNTFWGSQRCLEELECKMVA